MKKQQWKTIKSPAGFTFCVPVETPDNYFQLANQAYEARAKVIAECGEIVRARREHDERWPLGAEHYGDTYLVEEKGIKL